MSRQYHTQKWLLYILLVLTMLVLRKILKCVRSFKNVKDTIKNCKILVRRDDIWNHIRKKKQQNLDTVKK